MSQGKQVTLNQRKDSHSPTPSPGGAAGGRTCVRSPITYGRGKEQEIPGTTQVGKKNSVKNLKHFKLLGVRE